MDAPVLSISNLTQARGFSLSERLLSPERELCSLSKIGTKLVLNYLVASMIDFFAP